MNRSAAAGVAVTYSEAVSRWRLEIGFAGFFWLYWVGMPWAARFFVASRPPVAVSVLVLLADTGLAWLLAEVTSRWWNRRNSGDDADAVVADQPRWARRLAERKAACAGAFRAAVWSWWLSSGFLAAGVLAMTYPHNPSLRREGLMLLAFTAVVGVVACLMTAHWWRASGSAQRRTEGA